MSSTEVPEAPRAKRSLSTRPKAHARMAAIPAMPQRGSQSAGVSSQEWRGATTVANFWSHEGVSNSATAPLRNPPLESCISGPAGAPWKQVFRR